MQIRCSDTGALHIVLNADEAISVRDDLGQLRASKISEVGGQLHSLLDGHTLADCCPLPSYGTYLAHKKRGEDACEASKAKKRDYDRARYAKDPRKARAPQRAYEARQRACA